MNQRPIGPHSEEALLRNFRHVMGAAALGAALVSAAACLNPHAPTSVCTQVGTYNLGDAINDSLTPGDCQQGNGALADYYRFTTSGQEDLAISITSPGLLTFLQLLQLDGVIVMNSAITSNVDTTTTVRMKIGSGTWVVAVNAVNAGTRGRYHLTAATDTAAVKGCGTVWLTPGVLTTQSITNADCTQGPGGGNYYYHLYTIVLLQTQEINLSEHSTAFAPGMFLVGPTGTTVSSPDSLGTTAFIQATIATQGAYELWVGSANPSGFGTYTLTVR